MSIDRNHPEYVDLKKRIKEDSKSFIVIVGAGMSKSAGLPDWAELRNRLIKNCLDRQSDIPELELSGYINKLNRLSAENNLWQAFSELKHLMPQTAYEDCIKEALTIKDKSNIPSTYLSLWRLGIKGFVSFNLDTFATDSFAAVNHASVDTSTAREITRYANFLGSSNPFVFQPHGQVLDSETWVFTQSDKNRLYGTPAYLEFMKAILQTHHLLILGFGAGDFAFTYLMQSALAGRSKAGPKHYLVLPRPSPSVILEHSEKGIVVIPYIPDNPMKHEEINFMLNDILGYISTDEIPPSVYTGAMTNPNSLPPEDELIKLPIPEIRKLLNGAIAGIIPPNSSPQSQDIETLKQFYSNHVRSIHTAWLIHPSAGCNNVYEYKVLEQKNRGAFGQVYEAEDCNSNRVAIKVLLPEVREAVDYLTCFRRGVKSMRILTDHGLPRMVKFFNAYEVPASIVMEYVDGFTLTEANNNKCLDTLNRCLEVLLQIGETLVAAHDLDEQVLHRDLKPDNIILRDCYNKADSIDVVVLDFDLSWHKGAYEMSVVKGARAQGYAAPEQTATGQSRGVSTRSTAVDVFGFGMLAYFLFVGSDPRPNEHNIDGYEARIREAIHRRFPCKWHALPNYLANIIIECTADAQNERSSMIVAVRGFNNALDMISSDSLPASHPLILEEIIARLGPHNEINRLDFGRCIRAECMDASKEIELSLTNDYRDVLINIRLSKMSTGTDRNIAKYLENAKLRALAPLNCSLFQKTSGEIGLSRLDICAEWRLGTTVNKSILIEVCEKLIEARASLDL